MIWEVKEDALVWPSDLGLLVSFPLVRSEGKIGDRVVDAFFEKRQQVDRFVPAIQEALIKERKFFVHVAAQGAELVDSLDLSEEETSEDTGGMTRTWGDVLV